MFKKIFLQGPDRYSYWIIIAIIVKALFFYFNISENIPDRKPGVIYKKGGDTGSYIEPIENFIKKGTYSPDFRMPGYGISYLLFRLIFSNLASLNLLALLQLFLSSISVYILALLVKDIFGSDKWFYASFYLYLFSTFVSIWDIYILTESFAVSGLIFSVFYFVRAMKNFNYASLCLSGLFLTWVVFLRPVSLVLFCLFISILLVVWIRDYRYTYSRIFKGIIVFLMAFLLIDGLWSTRNYKIYKRWIPLQRSITYPEDEKDVLFMSLMPFLQSWGGNIFWWNPKAEINWFEYKHNSPMIRKQIKDIQFPQYIYTSKFNYQDLLDVKDYIARSKDETISKDERDKYTRLTVERLDKYTDSIRKEKPWVYYVYAPLNLFRKFLFHSGTYNLFNRAYTELNLMELMFKVLMSMVYLFVVIAGLGGALILFFKNYTVNGKLLIAAISLYCTIIYPLGFRYAELRYFAPAYPFMLICGLYFSYEVYKIVLNRRKTRLV